MLRSVPAAATLLRNGLLGSREAAAAVSHTLKTSFPGFLSNETLPTSLGHKGRFLGNNPEGYALFSTGRDRSDDAPPTKDATGVSSDDGTPAAAREAENTSPLGLAYGSAPEQMGPIQSVENLHLRGEGERGAGLTEQQVHQAAQPMSPLVEELDAHERHEEPQPAHQQAVSKLQGFATSW